MLEFASVTHKVRRLAIAKSYPPTKLKMDFGHFNQNQKKKKKPVVSTDNFIEALKGIGGGVARGVAKDVVAGTAQAAFDTLVKGPTLNSTQQSFSGELKPNSSLELDQLQKEQFEKQTKVEHRRLHIIRQKEETVFSAKEEQVKKEIIKTQEELKRLAKEAGNVAREVQVASMQQVVEPGQYHVGFFDHLRTLLKALREKLHDSAAWLKAANNRAQRKKGYWARFAKQGTKFSLNEERRLSTQTG